MAEMDIPGNSHKSQEKSITKTEKVNDGNGGKVVPVFDGETAGVRRKSNPSVWKWFRRVFLSDRSPKDIAKDVFEQNIVPSIQDNFRNSAMAMIDGIIYKNAAPSNVSSTNGVNYNRIYSGQQPRSTAVTTQQNAQKPARDPKQEEINKGFNNPCFRTQMEAARFLTLMKGYDYPTLSVHTMYMMMNKHIDYTWDAYGWTREEIAMLGPGCIKRIGNADWPFMLELPEAHVIA